MEKSCSIDLKSDNPVEHTFNKEERLYKRKLIKELFSEGSYFYLYPFKVLYTIAPKEECTTQVLFSVPKRKFKKAVDRNTIKRALKEAYRLQKHTLEVDQKLLIGYIYTTNKFVEYNTLFKKLKQTLLRLNSEVSERKQNEDEKT